MALSLLITIMIVLDPFCLTNTIYTFSRFCTPRMWALEVSSLLDRRGGREKPFDPLRARRNKLPSLVLRPISSSPL
jgi:hypothetical protein